MKPLFRLTVGLLLSSTLLCLPQARAAHRSTGGAATPPLATLEITASRLDWAPVARGASRLVLSVAGPSDFFYEKRFEPGSAPSFDPAELGSGRLADGTYSYELRQSGKGGDRVQSGFFAVRGGSFFVPTPGAEGPRPGGKPAGGLPLKDLDANGELIADNACIGGACVATDGGTPLRLKDTFLGIQFTDQPSGSSVDHDWAIQVNDNIGGGEYFAVQDTDNATTPVTITAGAATNSLFVSSAGRIGVGTSTPAVRLDTKVSTSGAAVARLQNQSGSGYSGTEYLDSAGNVALYFGTDNANAFTRFNSVNNFPIVLMTQSTERLRIASGGNIGIGGVTSPSSPIQHSNGATLSSGGVWTNASSRALKQDIHDLDARSAFDTLKGLNPVEFAYKLDPSEHHVGFIAEDVPALVAVNDRKGLSPMDVVAVLTKVVQEQQRTIEELSARLDAMEPQP